MNRNTDAPARVALLARPGAACERLQAALHDAGAELVLVSDPAQTDAEGIRAAGAQAILIALEPQVEDALDRYDALLADPAITVIFDEAELAAQREGWDAARWTRHLAAKLNRHEHVLPPGAEIDAAIAADPQPLHRYQRPEGDGDIGAFADEAGAHSQEVPRDFQAHPSTNVSTNVSMFDPVLAEMDLAPATGAADTTPNLDGLSLDGLSFEGLSLDGMSLDGMSLDGGLSLDSVSSDGDTPGGGTIPATAPPVEGIAFDGGALDLDPVDAAPANAKRASTPAFEGLALEGLAPDALAVEEHAVDGHAVDELPKHDPIANERFRRDLDDLQLRIADMQLEDSRLPSPARNNGAVAVLAGIGGPDAVRQLLAALPADFPRPVIIQQRLEGGRHDKLVRQMQRATTMPVHLAEAGEVLQSGHVYVLPTELDLRALPDGLRFESGVGDLLSGLPAAESAVILLSGSDPGIVDVAMSHALRGALVAGQSPDGCFDAAASDALVARGGVAGAPNELAKKLAERWRS